MNRFAWRHQYDIQEDEYHGDLARVENHEPSQTNQHFAKDADINVIMDRFGVTDGAIPPAALDPSHFGDFTDAVDFRDALDRTRIAKERFDALPANLRQRFGNSPLQLWQFVNDPDNLEEAVTLGLLKKEATPPSPPKELSTPPAST